MDIVTYMYALFHFINKRKNSRFISIALKCILRYLLLIVNDDVAFESSVIEDMIAEYEAKTKADNCKAMVGATYDDECKLSYGDNMK